MRQTCLTLALFSALLGTHAEAARHPFAGASTETRAQRTRDFDLLHVAVDITLDVDAGRISGRTTQSFSALRAGQSHLTLDQAELNISSISDATGRPLTFRTDGQVLDIDLGAAPPLGDVSTVTIVYTAQPRAGLYFIRPDKAYPDKATTVWTQGEMEDTRYWLPTWDFPNDRATSELTVTVPAAWSAISNGHLVGVTDGDGSRAFHWRQDTPHVTYLITLTAGDFEILRAVSKSGVELAYWVPRGRTGDIDRSFAKTPAIIDFFAEWTGVPYPWAKYDQIVVTDFIYGGMENTSATTLTDTTLHDDRAHVDYPSDGLVAHEAAHQWWGDLITCKSWSHIWLNEGFATFFEALWTEHDLGKDEYDYNMLHKADSYFEEDEGEYRRPVVSAVYDDPSDMFDSHTYQKGSLVLRMLRQMLGDADFQRGIRAWGAGHRDQVAETDELRIAIENATGRELTWFFTQWLFKPGYPEYQVETKWNPSEHVSEIRIQQTQSTDDGTPLFRMPLVVRLWNASGYRDHTIEVRSADQTIYLRSDDQPVGITIDPGNGVLKKLSYAATDEALGVQLTRSELAIDRILAARELGKRRTPKAIGLLCDAQKDDFWGVRAEAAMALGKTHDDSVFAELESGSNDTDSRVRRAAVEALGRPNNAVAIPLLLKKLDTDPSYAVRAQAALALGKIGGDGAFKHLTSALTQTSHRDVVRVKALEGVVELVEPGDKKAISLLKEWTTYGRPVRVRETALKGLGKLGKGDRSVRELLSEVVRHDPWMGARRSALSALGELGDGSAIEVLTAAMTNEIDGRVRRDARQALRKIRAGGDQSAVEKQLEELRERYDSLERKVLQHTAAEEAK